MAKKKISKLTKKTTFPKLKVVKKPAWLKKAEEDIDELESIFEVFAYSGRPESMAEFQNANKMAKWFDKKYKFYMSKAVYGKLPLQLKLVLNKIDSDVVGEFD